MATPAPTSPVAREQVEEAARKENTEEQETQPIRFTLFPNPTHGEVTIQIDKTVNQSFQIIVYNLCAKSLRQSSFAPLEKSTSLQLDGLPAGTYFIRIFHPRFEQTLKVMRYE